VQAEDFTQAGFSLHGREAYPDRDLESSAESGARNIPRLQMLPGITKFVRSSV